MSKLPSSLSKIYRTLKHLSTYITLFHFCLFYCPHVGSCPLFCLILLLITLIFLLKTLTCYNLTPPKLIKIPQIFSPQIPLRVKITCQNASTNDWQTQDWHNLSCEIQVRCFHCWYKKSVNVLIHDKKPKDEMMLKNLILLYEM